MIQTHESWFYRDAGSDKQYDLTIEEKDGTYTAFGRWGKRGALGKPQVWYSGPNLAEAQASLEKERAKRRKKGYTLDASGVPFTGICEAEGEHSGIMPMLLTAITFAAASSYIENAAYWLQQKFDGERRLVELGVDSVRGINRRGLYVGLPSDLVNEFTSLPGSDHVIDGEIIEGRFHAYDLVRVNGETLTTMPYRERFAALCKLIEGNVVATLISVARTETTPEGKRAFFELLQERELEGGVFKDAGSGLAFGTRSAHVLKCKFWEDATCIVDGINEQRSIQLGLVSDNGRVSVGNCQIPVNHEVPAVGAFVEIRYLYAYRDGALIQPKYRGARADVTIADCNTSQLKYKAEQTAA